MSPNTKEDANDTGTKTTTDPSILYGQYLSFPPPGEEICITGISGKFPNTRNIQEFRDSLMEKIDLIDDDDRRWPPFHSEIPQRSGKLYDIEKFDPGFFGIHYRQANVIDPMCRLFLESSIEAIMDSGYNPSELEGSRTGVFHGACYAESENEHLIANPKAKSFAMTGCMRSMIPNRVSYFLKLKGPSIVSDTACSSSLYAFENAYVALRTGIIDMAIVGGSNLCLHPFTTLQFKRLGVLSDDGKCKAFDNSGSGYCRSESCNCIILQRAKDARRIYSTVLHTKTGCDGYKDRGITFPSSEMQRRLLEEVYQEAGVDPKSISYLEAHGTGTVVGDPEEVEAIAQVFCKDRKTPLLMGSVKSNIGHTEPSSGLCSITKCIISMEEDVIAPNLHFSTPRQNVKPLVDGKIKIISEKTPFQDDNGLVGINSFGFGGGNCHVLLRRNEKTKSNDSASSTDLPRLVCVSARTGEGITSLIDASSAKVDDEYIGLLHQVFRKDIPGHLYRGYAVISRYGEVISSSKHFVANRQPLCLTFGNFGHSWRYSTEELMTFQPFAETMKRIQSILNTKGVDIMPVVTNSEGMMAHPVLFSIIGAVALHIGIVDLLKALKIQPDVILGNSIGEIACGYFEEILTLEEAILVAYEIGRHVEDLKEFSPEGVKKRYAKQTLDFELIWGNSSEINTSRMNNSSSSIRIAISPDHISKIENELLHSLKNIILKPRQKSSRWASSFTDNNVSAEFIVKALRSGSSIANYEKCIPKNGVVVKAGQGEVCQQLNGTVDVINFEVTEKDGISSFLRLIGSIYERGYNPQIHNIYPKVRFPVSRGTKMISPSIKWNHSKDWEVPKFRLVGNTRIGEGSFAMEDDEEEWKAVKGHVIDGRNLFPATGYLRVVWEFYCFTVRTLTEDIIIVFEDCKFKRALAMGQKKMIFDMMVQPKSGNFEVIDGDVDIVSGRVRRVEKSDKEFTFTPRDTPPPGSLKLKKKDVYKELRLRGYNYKGAFRGIQECNCEGTCAYVQWDGNWTSFMDNLLQIQILQLDTRLLYVPTGIKKLIIDPKKHLSYVEQFGDNPVLPVYASKDAKIIRCGGIEIQGLMASSIPRKKQRGAPVLEKYVFVADEAQMNVEESLRVIVQIGLENFHNIKTKVIEVIDEATREGSEPFGPKLFDVFADLPLIQPDISVFCKEKLELSNVTVEDRELQSDSDCHLIIGTNILQRAVMLQKSFSALKDKGFILSREASDFDPTKTYIGDTSGFDILTIHDVGKEKLVYFRRRSTFDNFVTIEVSEKSTDFRWLSTLQSAMSNDCNVLLYVENEPCNGLLGLLNCIRQEPGGTKVRCVIIQDSEAPKFDAENIFYKKQLSKNMVVNIYKNGEWGTYRHLLMAEIEEINAEHSFVNCNVRGDLSSLNWIQGNLSSNSVPAPEKTLVQVYYGSINFRDVMIASGRLNADVISHDRTEQECSLGLEFAGRDAITGKRVMGMVNHSALTTMLEADNHFLVDIPKKWSMEEAATIPVVYGTIIYAFEVGRLRKGDSILIHSGTGGVGQAAINYALAKGCDVFTTVGTPEKRDLIKKMFPQIRENRIGNSRDVSFEQMVKRVTKGRGVDLVLNSLAEEKLQASIRCLAPGGRFLEIGKFDLANNNPICLEYFVKGCSFHGIMLDQFFNAHPIMKRKVQNILMKGMREGYIKPLGSTVFKMTEVEKAFRHMTSGKHMGKVLIKIRDEEPQETLKPSFILTKGSPRFTCDPEKSYIICGGLGGFGLELADWLILRGAKKLVLTSRTGVQSGYQSYRLNIWKSYGIFCKISTANITTEEGCEQLIEEAESLGPIESIFNLAVVLKDALLENQSPENFRTSFGPKAGATYFLDKLTRQRCHKLKDFVVFSSVSCGRGNAGQTNYGMANSVMERLCEQRKISGYPALAIQWGAIGDVGLVADMMEEAHEMEIGGTLQQGITSCLRVLDVFLRQKEATIVSSMLVAEKRSASSDNIVDVIANVLGINKQAVSPHTKLSELGMDSMSAVEVKQTIEREFEIFLTAQDIRNLSLNRLQELQDSREKGIELQEKPQKEAGGPLKLIMRFIDQNLFSATPIYRIPSLVEDDPPNVPYLFLFPGVEGFPALLKLLAAKLRAKTMGIEFEFNKPTNNYKEIAMGVAKHIERYAKPSEEVNVVSHSWGVIICLETMSILEQKGYKGNIICIDGSPDLLKAFLMQELSSTSTDADIEINILCHLMGAKLSIDKLIKYRETIFKCKNLEGRLQESLKLQTNYSSLSSEFLKCMAISYITRMKELMLYEPQFPKLRSKVHLLKPTVETLHHSDNISEDLNLSRLCTEPVAVTTLEGNHVTILENPSVADTIHEIIGMK